MHPCKLWLIRPIMHYWLIAMSLEFLHNFLYRLPKEFDIDFHVLNERRVLCEPDI